MGLNILVTGANGQLGRMLRRLAITHDNHHYCFTDVQADEQTDALNILDKEAVHAYVREHQIERIINCAAYTAVDKAEDEEPMAEKINVLGVMNLASTRVKMIHISTDYVFDGEAHQPYDEEAPTAPKGAYGRTKVRGEKFLLTMQPDAVIFRTAWLYSEFGTNFVKTMIRLGQERSELNVVYDQIGTPTYAEDLAAAIFRVIEAEEWKGGIYHYTNLGVCSWYDFAIQIHKLYNAQQMLRAYQAVERGEQPEQQQGITCEVRPVRTSEYPTRAQRPAYSVLDKSKFMQTFEAEIPYWTDSLARCIAQL